MHSKVWKTSADIFTPIILWDDACSVTVWEIHTDVFTPFDYGMKPGATRFGKHIDAFTTAECGTTPVAVWFGKFTATS
jgi:hypothetical protein